MTGLLCALLLFVSFAQGSFHALAAPADMKALDGIEYETAAEAMILMEPESGAILYAKGITDSHYPASITKLMTALLVVESCGLYETVVFSEDAVHKNEGETSNIARDIGEEMTVEETLYGMLLASANECAWALAEHVSDGDVDAFCERMNERAKELGCVNTHFANPNGLHQDDHWTCAYDMALIARAAWQYEELQKILGTRYTTIAPTNKHDEETPLNNTHYMINNYKTDDYVWEACTGGKTGYTPEARSTLVTYAEKDGMTLICVVMDEAAPGQWIDTRAVMEQGFFWYEVRTAKPESDEIRAAIEAAAETGELVVPDQLSLTEPLTYVASLLDTEDGAVTFKAMAAETEETAPFLNILETGTAVAGYPYPAEDAIGFVQALTASGGVAGSAVLWYNGTGSYAGLARAAAQTEEDETSEEESLRPSVRPAGDRISEALRLLWDSISSFLGRLPWKWILPALGGALILIFLVRLIWRHRPRGWSRNARKRQLRTIERRDRHRRRRRR